MLASEQGLKELTDNFPNQSNQMKTGIFVSFMVACVLFSTSIAVMYLAEVENNVIKASVGCSVFILGIVLGLVYMYCVTKKNRLLKAV